MRMRQQHSASERTNSGEHECGESAILAELDPELETGKKQKQPRERLVLKDLGILNGFPETIGAERPALRIGAQENEQSESRQQQRPIARNPRGVSLGKSCQHA